MARKPPTKAELRTQLERQTRRYLNKGGKVKKIPKGVTGADPLKGVPLRWGGLFAEPQSSRTYLPEVVAAIETRRKDRLKRRPMRKRSRLPQPRRKVIYDDFGEPIRKVWVDD